MTNGNTRSCGATLLAAISTAACLSLGCSGSDAQGSANGASGGSTASAGETSSGGSSNVGSGGSAPDPGGSAGTGGTRVSCDADGDDRRSLDCGGDDCNDQSEDVSPEIETDLNLDSTPPYEEGVHQVFQVAWGSAGELFVLYRLGEAELRLASWSEGEWTDEAIVPTAVARYEGATMAVDADGKLHVALLSVVAGSSPVARDVYYATNAGGTWELVQVTDSSAMHPSALHLRIALDGDGYVHIGFSGQGLQHASNASGSWAVSKIADGGSGALATDPNGVVHAVRASGVALFYGPRGTEGFELAGPVEDFGSGDLVAAFDAKGLLHVAAVGLDDDSARVLKYAIIDGSTVTAVDTGIANPDAPHLVPGAEGEIHVFSGVKIASGHLVGMVHGFVSDAGFEKQSVHSTPSYVQEDFGFPSIDASGRLHRITPDFGRHAYSDDVDNDCDGTLW